MPERQSRRRVKGLASVKLAVSVDVLTDAAVRALMTRENLNYSQGLCALATRAALKDKELAQVIKQRVEQAVAERVARDGWTPGLGEMLSRELLGINSERYSWS